MTTETLTLTDFLLARIAATEAEANYVRNVGVSGPQYGSINGALSHVLDDVLAQCKAHRAIVERAGEPVAHAGQDLERTFALRALASIYADHPSFRQEWAL
jgi:hypothetical protein